MASSSSAPSDALKSMSLNERKQNKSEGDNDSGVDESTQKGSPKKTAPPGSPAKTAPRSRGGPGSRGRPPVRSQSVPKPFSTYGGGSGSAPEKKVPMNKIRVGTTSSPNIKQVRSKIGSLDNATHKAKGGDVKIENRKLEWKTGARTKNFNEEYTPKGGDKKSIESRKLAWNAASKVGSLDNARHKAGGGEKKIESQRLDWKANSKIGSTDNMKHKPGGGNIKILNQRVSVDSAKSRVGSLDNMKHRPGGGEKKVFNDVDYLRQMSETTASGPASRSGSRRQSASQTPEPPPLSAPAQHLNIEI